MAGSGASDATVRHGARGGAAVDVPKRADGPGQARSRARRWTHGCIHARADPDRPDEHRGGPAPRGARTERGRRPAARPPAHPGRHAAARPAHRRPARGRRPDRRDRRLPGRDHHRVRRRGEQRSGGGPGAARRERRRGPGGPRRTDRAGAPRRAGPHRPGGRPRARGRRRPHPGRHRARGRPRTWQNPALLWATAAAFGLQVVAVQLPVLQTLLGTTALSAGQLAAVSATAGVGYVAARVQTALATRPPRVTAGTARPGR